MIEIYGPITGNGFKYFNDFRAVTYCCNYLL